MLQKMEKKKKISPVGWRRGSHAIISRCPTSSQLPSNPLKSQLRNCLPACGLLGVVALIICKSILMNKSKCTFCIFHTSFAKHGVFGCRSLCLDGAFWVSNYFSIQPIFPSTWIFNEGRTGLQTFSNLLNFHSWINTILICVAKIRKWFLCLNIDLFLYLDIYLDLKKNICSFLIIKLTGIQCI